MADTLDNENALPQGGNTPFALPPEFKPDFGMNVQEVSTPEATYAEEAAIDDTEALAEAVNAIERETQSMMSIFYNSIMKNNWKQAFTPRNKYRVLWTAPEVTVENLTLVNNLNGASLYIDNIDLPKITLDTKTINDGRGIYHVQGDSIPVAEGGLFSVVFREVQQPVIESVIDPWLQRNATPFVRPVYLNFYVQFISDADGNTPVLDYLLIGVRPQGYRTPNPDHGSKSIMLRDVSFICNGIKPSILFDANGKINSKLGLDRQAMKPATKAPERIGFFKNIYQALAGK